ncbi:MAG: hypothetical protein AAF226_01480 [Verrucomicrobiota bacterium]
MKLEIREFLTKHRGIDFMVDYLSSQPEEVASVLEFAAHADDPDAWRGAWILNHFITEEHPDLVTLHPKLIAALLDAKDGHQRELLRLLEKVTVHEDEEGKLFDACIAIWTDLKKSGSARITAFRVAASFLKVYPELAAELRPLTTSEYTVNLTPGIRNSFQKLVSRSSL